MKGKRKYLITGILCLFVLISIFLKSKNKKIDPFKITDEKIIELLKSDRIKNLSSEGLSILANRLEKIPFEKIENYFEKLPEKLKRKFEENFEEISYARLDKKIDEFFNSSDEKKEKILDEEIERLEKAEKEGIILPEYSEIYEENVSQTGGFPSFQRGRFYGRGFSRNRNPDAALQRQRDRLSRTTPQQRAKRQEFFKKLRERRARR